MKKIFWGVFFLGLSIILLDSCAPTARLPDIKSSEVKIEEDRQKKLSFSNFTKHFQRAYKVTYRINTANVDLCDKKGLSLGFDYTNSYAVGEKNAEYYPVELNMGTRISIVSIGKNSPAEKVGLKIGDKVESINDIDTPQGRKAISKFSKFLTENLTSESTKITISRDGNTKQFDLNPQEVCGYPLVFIPDQIINAFADGKRTIITQGIAEYTKDDNELALVIGHELAHNNRDHIDKKKVNTLLAGLVGFALDMASASGGGYYGGPTYTEKFMKLGAQVFSVQFEQEADYAGLYYAARAGFDVTNANEFWTRMGAKNPSAIAHNSTHPATAKRFVALRAALKEIENKRKSNLPIMPNEKEKKIKKKTEKKKFDLKKLLKMKKK
jgi:hypothetical protein|tara:strand:- start:53 stop:1201 length:1149 start_codon:yes stop_codon:yes gene_type:complete